ncbi:aminotransferase class V-fold PLP-dependent enzyme [bacterium]|nr:aminotransferase class V-fold PLP-dependent enzyme [bacterium]
MIYLDNAATSFPKPESVYQRISEVLREKGGNPGKASHTLAIEASRIVFRARESVAMLMGVPDSSRIIFTKNATEAINIALKGLLKPGDHLVTSTFEHNAVARCVLRLERSGVEATRVAPDEEGFLSPASIGEAIRRNTRMVVISHASNVFGAIQPLDEIGRICKTKGVIFMSDAAQTMGAMPLDVRGMGVNVLAATGHKALFGPQGTGFLYVEEGIEPEPLVDGGSGGEGAHAAELPERLEAGTLNTPGIGGLGAGVEFLLSEKLPRIKAREEALVDMVLNGISGIERVSLIGPRDASRRAALVSFNIEGVSPSEAGLRLDREFGIMARCGTHCAPEAHRQAGTWPEGSIRVSPGYFTTEGEIEALIRAVKKLASR